MTHSNVVSQIMSKIPYQNRAYSLQQAMGMGEECLSLVLDSRLHSTIPLEIFDLKNLISLSLENIQAEILPTGISNLSSLKILNLIGTRINVFPEEINHIKLEAFFISDNEWKEIPDFILKSKELKSLSIINSQLIQISSRINQLFLLEEINLENNLIKKIVENFYDLINLKKINLSKNNIISINKIHKLNSLKLINFNNNKIALIPEKINYLTQLNSINLSNNKIELIPNSISDLNLISTIILNNNKIKKVDDSFFTLPLSFLDLSNNKINDIPNSIYLCKRLRELNINKNPLNDFPKGILGLNNLNKIKGINKILSAEKRKYVIPYIAHCSKNNFSLEKRIQLWDAFLNIDECNQKQLIALLNSNFRPFKSKASEQLTNSELTQVFNKEVNIYIAGRTKIKKSKLNFALLEKGIQFSNQFSQGNTHILLGSGKYNSEIPTKWKGAFMKEKELLEQINYSEKENSQVLKTSTIESLKKLLTSSEQNLELALHLLQNKNIPEELFTILFFISISNLDSKKRIKAKQLIKSELKQELNNLSIKDFQKESRIKKILNLINSNKINKKEFIYLLFNHSKKGWLFIKENYDNTIISKLNNSKILNLSNADLNLIPTEIKNTNSKKIDLSNNQLNKINNKDLLLLNNFKEINLSNNPIEEITPEFLKLKNLRILNIKNCKLLNQDLLMNKAPWVTIFK